MDLAYTLPKTAPTFATLPFRYCGREDCGLNSDTAPLGTRWLLCSRCLMVRYCSGWCGTADWPVHRPFCDAIHNIEPPVIPSDRVAVRTNRNGAEAMMRMLMANNWFDRFLVATAHLGHVMWGPGVLMVKLTGTGITCPRALVRWLTRDKNATPNTEDASRFMDVCTSYLPTADAMDKFAGIYGTSEPVSETISGYDPGCEGVVCFTIRQNLVVSANKCADGGTMDVVMRLGAHNTTAPDLMALFGSKARLLVPGLHPGAKRTWAGIRAAGTPRSDMLNRTIRILAFQRKIVGVPDPTTDDEDRSTVEFGFGTRGTTAMLRAPIGPMACPWVQVTDWIG